MYLVNRCRPNEVNQCMVWGREPVFPFQVSTKSASLKTPK